MRKILIIMLSVILCSCNHANQVSREEITAQPEDTIVSPEAEGVSASGTEPAAVSEEPEEKEEERLTKLIIEELFEDIANGENSDSASLSFANLVYEENPKVIEEFKGMLNYYKESGGGLILNSYELDTSGVNDENVATYVIATISYTKDSEENIQNVTFYFTKVDGTVYIQDIDWGELIENVPFDLFVKADGFYEEQAITEFLDAFNDSVDTKEISNEMQDFLDYEISSYETKNALTELLNQWITDKRSFHDFIILYDPTTDIVDLGNQNEEMSVEISYCDEEGNEQSENMNFELVYFEQQSGYYTGQRGITIANLTWDKLDV